MPRYLMFVVLAAFGNDFVIGPSTASHAVLVPPDDLCDFMHFISNNLSSLPAMTAQFYDSFSQA